MHSPPETRTHQLSQCTHHLKHVPINSINALTTLNTTRIWSTPPSHETSHMPLVTVSANVFWIRNVTRYWAIFSLLQTSYKLRQRIGHMSRTQSTCFGSKMWHDTEQYFYYLKHLTNSDNALATCHKLSQRVLDLKRITKLAMSTFSPVGSLFSDGLSMSVCVCACIALT